MVLFCKYTALVQFEEIGEDESLMVLFSYANMEIIFLQEDLLHM